MSETLPESNAVVGVPKAEGKPSNNELTANAPEKKELTKSSTCDTCPAQTNTDSTKFIPTLCLPSQKIQDKQIWVLSPNCTPVNSAQIAIASREAASADTVSGAVNTRDIKLKREVDNSLNTCDVAQLVLSGFVTQVAPTENKEQKPQAVEYVSQAMPQSSDRHTEPNNNREENHVWDDLHEFAKSIRERRIALRLTQADVGHALGALYGNVLSQTTISRFEALQLSTKNMQTIRPLLEKWLKEAGNEQFNLGEGKDTKPNKKRKRRTIIGVETRSSLEHHYENNPKPSPHDCVSIADELGLDKEVVRVWFCNRRQKAKRSDIMDKV